MRGNRQLVVAVLILIPLFGCGSSAEAIRARKTQLDYMEKGWTREVVLRNSGKPWHQEVTHYGEVFVYKVSRHEVYVVVMDHGVVQRVIVMPIVRGRPVLPPGSQ